MSVEPDAASWSPDRIAQLRLHHDMGLSAALSAELIGGVSRNAVISKRRRLGLVGANPLQAAMRRVRRAAQIARASACVSSPPDAWSLETVLGLRCEPLPFMDWPAPPNADPRPLADRDVGECAWPLGVAEAAADYRTLFCCAPVSAGASYCGFHAQRVYRPRDAGRASGGR
jgi:GcrA cell cycle regulator